MLSLSLSLWRARERERERESEREGERELVLDNCITCRVPLRRAVRGAKAKLATDAATDRPLGAMLCDERLADNQTHLVQNKDSVDTALRQSDEASVLFECFHVPVLAVRQSFI